MSTIQSISQFRINLPTDLRGQHERNTAFKAVGEIKRRLPDGPTLLDPIRNLGINDKSFKDLVKVRRVMCGGITQYDLIVSSKLLCWRTRSNLSPSPNPQTFHANTICLTGKKKQSRMSNRSSGRSIACTMFYSWKSSNLENESSGD